ncbi:MAG: Urocanate reductase [Syntrophus sp. SKADARSKE-3]|nr:Urocanate reductase [Syntrophus sp. SKADARSKE-3]
MEKSGKELTRRTFMKGAAVGAGATVLLGSMGNAMAAATPVPRKWDVTTDVLIIGFGGSGACAAIEAHDAGAKVLMLEKMPMGGGSTSLSGGIVYAAGTSVQKNGGITDTAEGMYKYWMAVNDNLVDPDITRYLAEDSAATLDWLINLGVEFKPEKIYVSGLESQYASITPVAKRGHQATGKGGGIMIALQNAVKKRKIDVRYRWAAERLIVNPAGEVLGVLAKDPNGKKVTVKAKRGVVIASGGIGRNKDLIKKYYPAYLKAAPVAGLGSTGDGILMAQKIGAPMLTGATDPPDALPGIEIEKGKVVRMLSYATLFYKYPTIFVNEKAKRFIDETAYYQICNPVLIRQKEAYVIFDKRAFDAGETIGYGLSKGLKNELETGAIKTAQTIPALAKQVGLNPDELAKTVEMHNKNAAAGLDAEFDKKKALAPLDRPPYYIAKAGVSLVLCLAGLAVNKNTQVLDAFGEVIPRLYSVGEANWTFPVYVASGCMLSHCFVYGRVAGRNVAKEKART